MFRFFLLDVRLFIKNSKEKTIYCMNKNYLFQSAFMIAVP